jgi:hypothetical protein
MIQVKVASLYTAYEKNRDIQIIKNESVEKKKLELYCILAKLSIL